MCRLSWWDGTHTWGTWEDKLYHPLFLQTGYIPATTSCLIRLTKCNPVNTNNSGGDFQYMFFNPDGTLPTRKLQVQAIRFQLMRIQLTNVGLSVQTAMLNRNPLGFVYPMFRTDCQRYFLSQGTQSFVINAGAGAKPQFVALHWVDANASNYDTWLNQYHPFTIAPSRDQSTSDGGIQHTIQTLYVRIGNERYPENYDMSNTSTNVNTSSYNCAWSGGTIAED